MKISCCAVMVLVSVACISAAPYSWQQWVPPGSLGSGNGVGNYNTDGGNHGNGLGNNNGPKVNNVENYNGYDGKNGPGYKENEKPTTVTVYNGESSGKEEGGKHNGKHNKGGINGHDNTGDYNGNYNEGGVNGNGNGGSFNGNHNKGGYNGNGNGGSNNGNGNTGGGMNGNGNGGDGEIDWQQFVHGLNLGGGDGYEPGYGPANWQKYLKDNDEETKASPARKTTTYATRKTTPYGTRKMTTDSEVTTYAPKQTTRDYGSWDNQNWGVLDQDYWDNFNKQFQPGGRYHWETYQNKYQDNDEESTASARKTTPYATRKTTPYGTREMTTDSEVTTYAPKQTTRDYGSWDNRNWVGPDQDYWDNFNKQFQPGGRYHWKTYQNKNQNHGNYGNYRDYGNYGGW